MLEQTFENFITKYVEMKTIYENIKLLSIISILLVISACVNEKKAEIKEVGIQKKTKEDSINTVKKDSLIKAQQIQDSVALVEKKKKEELKVIIDGKVYYKRNKNDYQLNGKYVFRTRDEMTDYDIRKDGTLPSGYNTGEEDIVHTPPHLQKGTNL